MKINGNKISDFLDLYYTLDSASEFQRYIYGSRLNFCVILEIAKAQYLGGATSFEKLCSAIPKSFGSRASIQNICNVGFKSMFLTKSQSKNDKRVQDILIKDEYLKYIDLWVKMHTGVFDPAVSGKKRKIS